MILDNINNYDLSTFMGIDLSSFKTDTLYFVSILFVFSVITIITVLKNEKNKVNSKNMKKEKLSLIEKERYKTEAKLKFEDLNKKENSLTTIYKNIDDIIVIIEEFVKNKKSDPIYSTFSVELLENLSEYQKNKMNLLNVLNQGVVINTQNEEFIKYKDSTLKINNGYKNILRYSIKQDDLNRKIDITDI